MATKSISQLDSATSVSASDLYEVAVPDGQSASGYASKKESGAQIATFFHEGIQNNNLNTTDKTVVGAINEVDSEGVKWESENILGSKNLIYYPFNGSFTNGGSYVHRGVTFTDYGNGAVFADGDNNGNGASASNIVTNIKLQSGNYVLTGGISSSCLLRLAVDSGGGSTTLGDDTGSGFEFTVTEQDATNNLYRVVIVVPRYESVDNVVLYPMIRLKSDNISTWKPYAATNRDLTMQKAERSQLAPSEWTTVASQAYAIGDYMLWYGGLYKVTAAISAGGAITEGTNVTATTIGAELKAALNS